MLGTIYTGLSGMSAYSRGLDTISNNVANLNTAGFKASTPEFSNLVFQSGSGAVGGAAGPINDGAGVSADANRLSFAQGEFRTTGNGLDAAVDGNGWFVLQEEDGRLVLTRAGQFEINKDGDIVDVNSGAALMFVTDESSMTSLNIDTLRVYDPKVTTEVKLTGTLARSGDSTTFEVPNLTVVDTSGGTQTLTARFVRDADDPLKWTLEITDKDGAVLGSGSVAFDANGTPVEGSNSVTVTVTPQDLPAFDVTFSIGDPGTFAGVTSPSGGTTSQVQLRKQDGVQLGALTTMSFTEKGELKLGYSNGETKTVGRLVLARIDSPEQLEQLGGSRFRVVGNTMPALGTALTQGLGRVVGGEVELSNVDLTGQFTDLIVIQRGYQASSQMVSTANEMLQQLLTMTGRP